MRLSHRRAVPLVDRVRVHTFRFRLTVIFGIDVVEGSSDG